MNNRNGHKRTNQMIKDQHKAKTGKELKIFKINLINRFDTKQTVQYECQGSQPMMSGGKEVRERESAIFLTTTDEKKRNPTDC